MGKREEEEEEEEERSGTSWRSASASGSRQ